jgi:hypothetical protein
MFVVKARICPSEAHGVTLYALLLALPANIKLVWKGLGKILAYFKIS